MLGAVWELQKSFPDLTFLLSKASFQPQFPTHCKIFHSFKTATCIQNMIGVRNDMLSVKYFAEKLT